MKTFEEAMARCVKPAPESESERQTDAEAMAENQIRSHDLHVEIVTHPYTIAWVECVLENVSEQLNYDVRRLMLMAFSNGVLVGMDMEKTEL